jgi:NADH-quinone oxidoreductase subunit L
MSPYLILIPLLPLAGFLVNALVRLPRAAAAAVGCLGPIASFGLSVAALRECPVRQRVFEWITVGEWSLPLGLAVDPLAAVMILVVTGVGSLIHVYSVGYMHEDPGIRRYFAYLNLFMFSMLVLVMADSILLMFVGWEGVGLCSYLLIGFWYKDLKNADAGKKAFVTNRIGDFGFLLGIFLLWQLFGSLDFGAMASKPIPGGDRALVAAAGLLLFVGACGKSAQIPLHVWLPDAMAGPTPVSALIHAATMVTAGVYMIGRMHFLYAALPGVREVVAVVAAATALMAALIAVAQNDIKKVLAYSTISQLGFMFAGMAAAHFTTGIFHLVTHAFFKALLFLGAGAVIHALHGEQDIRKMGGLVRKMPLLAMCFFAGGLALSGMPLTAGYVSKDAILAAADLGAPGPVWALLVATAFLTAFYTTRVMLVVFMPRGEEHAHHELHPPGFLMMAPLVVLAALSLGGGLVLEHPLGEFLRGVWGSPGVPPGEIAEAHHFNQQLSMVVFLAGFLLAFVLYGRARGWLQRWVEGPGRGLHWLVSNKFFVDEIYEYAVVAPVRMGATVTWFLVDRILIDAVLVHGAGRLAYLVGGVFRRPHSGSLNAGLAAFVLGALAALAYLFYRLALWTSRS